MQRPSDSPGPLQRGRLCSQAQNAWWLIAPCPGLCPSYSARTTSAIERLHEEFKRRVKTQTVPPSAETAAMLFWSLLASRQITMRKIDGWQDLGAPPASMPLDLVA